MFERGRPLPSETGPVPVYSPGAGSSDPTRYIEHRGWRVIAMRDRTSYYWLAAEGSVEAVRMLLSVLDQGTVKPGIFPWAVTDFYEQARRRTRLAHAIKVLDDTADLVAWDL